MTNYDDEPTFARRFIPERIELFDEFGMPLAIGDTVLVAGEIGVVGKIEAFESGGVTRDDTHRVLVSDYPFYVRPCNLIKLAVLSEYTP